MREHMSSNRHTTCCDIKYIISSLAVIAFSTFADDMQQMLPECGGL